MNKKQLIILICISLTLAVLAGISLKIKSSTWNKPAYISGEKLLDDFDVNAVSKILIKDSISSLEVSKKGGRWVVSSRYDYPADFNVISTFVNMLHEMRVLREIKAGKSHYKRLELLPPDTENSASTLLEFYDDRGKKLVSLIAGKLHYQVNEKDINPYINNSEANGRYLLVHNALSRPVLVRDPLREISTDPSMWLNKKLFNIAMPKAVMLKNPAGSIAWKLVYDKKSKVAYSPDPPIEGNIDIIKIKQMLISVKFPTFLDVAPREKRDDTSVDKILCAVSDSGVIYCYKLRKTVNETFEMYPEIEFPDGFSEEDKIKYKDELFYTKWTYTISGKYYNSILDDRRKFSAAK